ncbi:hypothetical protein QBC41DRAFT_63488 [Cercophora samala]|uniref:Uncharacterized protein n=1 Tax=Cercophora samala TaxID=330535 RepID=A0AA39ZI23_9PEZI|nr:hypothetical protein QBC41DRAFT_63488 [Cercophora samala]
MSRAGARDPTPPFLPLNYTYKLSNEMDVFGVSFLDDLNFSTEAREVRCIDILCFESSPAQVQDHTLNTDSDEFGQWLKQEGPFSTPDTNPNNPPPTGRLRLVSCIWSRDSNWALPFSKERWTELSEVLQLPASYDGDLTATESSGFYIAPINSNRGPSSLGISLNFTPTADAWISTALSYTHELRLTQGFLAVHEDRYFDPSSGFVLLNLLQAKDHAREPLVLPLVIYRWAVEFMKNQLHVADGKLQSVKHNLGVFEAELDTYWRIHAKDAEDKSYTVLHERIVTQHQYLTAWYKDMILDLGDSIGSAISQIENHSYGTGHQPEVGKPGAYDGFRSRQFLQLISARNRALFLWHSRLVQEIPILLQVLYNLMQQDIARETRRDSSAMKSIALLTMVFLPGTAIATVMAPFTRISDEDDKLQLSAHFWVFWAVAGPVTLAVLAIWGIWIQRNEVNKALKNRLEKLENAKIMSNIRTQKIEASRAFEKGFERLKGMEILRKRNRGTPGDVELNGVMVGAGGLADQRQGS